jgi:hypothetical protein
MINLYEYYNAPCFLDDYDKCEPIRVVHNEYTHQPEKNTPEAWHKVRHAFIRNPSYICFYATQILKNRWPEGEPTILNDAGVAYEYAKNIIHGRWPEAENILLNMKGSGAPYICYLYAMNIVGGRWHECEPIILSDYEATYFYSSYVIKDRWIEGEKALLEQSTKDRDGTYYLAQYAKYVIYGRWLEAEKFIKTNTYHWKTYTKDHNIPEYEETYDE